MVRLDTAKAALHDEIWVVPLQRSPGPLGFVPLQEQDRDGWAQLDETNDGREPEPALCRCRRTVDIPRVRVPRQQISGFEPRVGEQLALECGRVVVVLDAQEA